MLLRPDYSAIKMEFNIYPKAKYELSVYKEPVYSFVTTRISEKEAIKLLEEKLLTSRPCTHKYYYIKKTVDGIRKTIVTGINPKYVYKKQSQ